jgi:hypothetical protein
MNATTKLKKNLMASRVEEAAMARRIKKNLMASFGDRWLKLKPDHQDALIIEQIEAADEPRAAYPRPFVISAKGKIKTNIIAAFTVDEAIEIFNTTYPRFAKATKRVAEVTQSQLLD